jgi:hypothetical protein
MPRLVEVGGAKDSNMGGILLHWRKILGGAVLIWTVIREIIKFAGDVDFVITRSQDPGWVAVVINALLDPPGWLTIPLILVGLLLIYWDSRRTGSRPRRAKSPQVDKALVQRQLSDLFDEGVKERNRLLSPIADYDEKHERRRLTNWSDTVVQKLDEAGVKLSVRSRFKTLNLFVPQHHPAAGRSPSAVKLEAIWNEKLDRLRVIIDGF